MSDGLPPGWENTTLSEVARPTRPRELPSDNPHFPFIGMENVEAHTMRLLGTVKASFFKSSAVHFQPHDVLYGRLRPYLNKVYRPDFEGLCSAEFIVFPDDGQLSTAWLAYLLNSSDFVSFSSHQNEGDRPRVDFDQIGAYRIGLPPRPEQDRIVAEIEKQFTRLDAAVAALKRVQANLKRYRAAVLKAACEGRLVPTEAELARKEGRSYETGEQVLARILKERRAKWESDHLAKMRSAGNVPRDDSWKKKYKEPEPPDSSGLPILPAGWAWAALESVVDAIDPQPSHRTPPEFPRGVPYIGMGDVGVDGVFDRVSARKVSGAVLQEHRERYQLKHGDFFIGKIGTIGTPVLVRPPFDFTLSANVVLIQPTAAAVDSRFLFHWMCSPTAQALMEKGSRATTQAAFGIQRVRVLPCPIPPASEQTRISEAVEEQLSDASAASLTVSHRLLSADRLRQSILKRAFEGKLVPQDPNDEPAVVLLERIRAERATKAQPPKNGPKPRKARVAAAEVV